MDAGFAQLTEDPDGVGDTGFQRVVCVYKKSAGVGIQARVFLECSVLVFKAHDPAVGMGTQDRNIEHFTGQYVGCSHTAPDHCGSGTV